MSVEILNGKMQPKHGSKVSAPTPAQIAERAYELACGLVVDEIETGAHSGMTMEDYLASRKADTLAALRESVISPGPIPWWKK